MSHQNGELIADHLPHAVCTGCGRNLPSIRFRKDSTKPLGRSTRCKDCSAEVEGLRETRNLAHREHAIRDGHLRVCKRCGEQKPVQMFPPSGRNTGGSMQHCYECEHLRHLAWRDTNREHVREKSRTNDRVWRSTPSGREKMRARVRKHRLKRYGLTEIDVAVMTATQGNRCAICHVEFSESKYGAAAKNIDHDHATGLVRGMLCTKCNRGLGLFGDDVARLAKAIEYLAQRSGKCPPQA